MRILSDEQRCRTELRYVVDFYLRLNTDKVMNRTNIIEHYKKFHGLSELTEDCQIDIDWAEALIEDMMQVNKNCNIPDVISCGCPEWLDVGTRAEAKHIWESHKITDDGMRVKAVKFIQQRAKDCGYEIRISKAMELLKSHCL